MKILVIALSVIVVLLGAGMGFLFMNMNKAPDPAAMAAQGQLPAAEAAPVVETRDAIYTSLNPAFVITYKTATGMRYLQTELQIMSYELDVINEIDTNRPALRNNIIMLLSEQDFDMVESTSGREKVRNMIKEVVQNTLRTHLPVEEVYYNTFVLQ